jgi:hypothetical protein
MPRKRTKAAAPAVPQEDNIFDYFAKNGRMDLVPQDLRPAPAQAAPQKADDDKTAALLERINRLEGQLTDSRRASLQSSAPSAPHTTVDPTLKAVQVSMDGLPDPSVDLAGYNSQLQTRINAAIQAQTEAVRQESRAATEQNSATEKLWAQFRRNYPEWAEHEGLVDMVATRVANRAVQQGLDGQKYVLGNSDLFLADVAKELQTQYGRLLDDDESEEGVEGEPPTAEKGRNVAPTRRPAQQDELDDGRTAGIMGGNESGGKPVAGKPTSQGSDMIKDLQDIQKATGFY